MKKYILPIAFIVFISISELLPAQQPPPPPPRDHGSGNNQPSGAPVGDGLIFLWVLGAIYVGIRMSKRKVLKAKNTAEA